MSLPAIGEWFRKSLMTFLAAVWQGARARARCTLAQPSRCTWRRAGSHGFLKYGFHGDAVARPRFQRRLRWTHFRTWLTEIRLLSLRPAPSRGKPRARVSFARKAPRNLLIVSHGRDLLSIWGGKMQELDTDLWNQRAHIFRYAKIVGLLFNFRNNNLIMSIFQSLLFIVCFFM